MGTLAFWILVLVFTGLFVAQVATRVQRAQDQETPLRSIAKKTGIATDVVPPADFVLKSRPSEPPGPMPVFGTPDETGPSRFRRPHN